MFQKRGVSPLLEPGKEHHIPVSCVEQGRWRPYRWRYREPREPRFEEVTDFEVAAYRAHSELRRRKVHSALMAFQTTGRPEADQAEVWAEVARKLRVAETESPTVDVTAFYEKHARSVNDLLDSVQIVTNQVGTIVAIGNEVAGMEIFDHPETWKVLHRHILSGYAADALEVLWRGKPSSLLTRTGAEAFRDTVVAALERAPVKPAPVGLGEHYLLDRNGHAVSGFALVHEGRVRHLFAFPARFPRW